MIQLTIFLSIKDGLMLLVGISTQDTKEDVEKLSSRVLKLRLFEDEAGTMWKKSVGEINGQILSGKFGLIMPKVQLKWSVSIAS